MISPITFRLKERRLRKEEAEFEEMMAFHEAQFDRDLESMELRDFAQDDFEEDARTEDLYREWRP